MAPRGHRLEQTAPKIDIVRGKGYRRPAGRTDYLLFRPFSEERDGGPARHYGGQARRLAAGTRFATGQGIPSRQAPQRAVRVFVEWSPVC